MIWVRSLVAVFNTTRHALSLELSRLATALEEAAEKAPRNTHATTDEILAGLNGEPLDTKVPW